MTQDPGHAMTELLPAYVAGTLDGAEARDVESHLATCAACRDEADEWRVVRSGAYAAAAAAPVAPRGALDRVFARIDAASRPPGWRERLAPRALRRPLVRRSLAGMATAAVLALLVGFTPVGSYAQGLLQSFRPTHFKVVPVTLADVQALPSLSQYGDFAMSTDGQPQTAADAAAAGTAAGMPVLVPGSLPASVTAAPAYVVVPGGSVTFTFSAARAHAAAAAAGESLPAMPANIDGSSVQMTLGTSVVAVYGGNASLLAGIAGGHDEQGALGGALGAAGAAAAGDGAGDGGGLSLGGIAAAIPQLIVAQAPAPVATATGASVTDLEQYLLDLPGISPQLASALRAIGDPTTTWPIPVPLGAVNTHGATVQGASATVFTDTSGFASGVLWVKDGTVYAVAAPLGEQDVLRVANSLR